MLRRLRHDTRQDSTAYVVRLMKPIRKETQVVFLNEVRAKRYTPPRIIAVRKTWDALELVDNQGRFHSFPLRMAS